VSAESTPTAAAPVGVPRSSSRIAAGVGGIVLGGVFLVAGAAKVVDPEAFAEVVKAEGLAFALPASAVAMLAIALEIGLGLALVLGLRTRRVLMVSTALVLGFLFLTGRAYVDHLRGVERAVHSCGCFGNLVDRSPTAAFWQDVGMLVPATALAWLVPVRAARPGPRRRWAVVAAGTAAAVALGFFAPRLPLDDLVTRLHVGDPVGEICTDALGKRICLVDTVPPLAEGRHLVILADLHDEAFVRELPTINAYVSDGAGPELWVLVDADKSTISKFCLTAGAACPILPGPPALLRPLYRRLPRSFLVVGGRVETIWSGLPPFRSLTASTSR